VGESEGGGGEIILHKNMPRRMIPEVNASIDKPKCEPIASSPLQGMDE